MGGAHSKTSDVIMRGKDMSGLTAIVTGARIGIGAEMAWQMAAAGARSASQRHAPVLASFMCTNLVPGVGAVCCAA